MHTIDIELDENLFYAVHIDEKGESQKLSIGLDSELEALEFIEKLYEVYDE